MQTKNRALRDLYQLGFAVWIVGMVPFGAVVSAGWDNQHGSIFLTLVFLGYSYLGVPLFRGAKNN